jgi:hypothetical protein
MMERKLLRPVIATGLLAITLGGCTTIPSQPPWYPAGYYVPPPPPPPPQYAARPRPHDPAMMQMQPPPPVNNGHSWGHDLATAGAGAGLGIAGTQLAKPLLGGGAAAETAAGAAEAAEGAEVFEGVMTLLLDDWWMLLL